MASSMGYAFGWQVTGSLVCVAVGGATLMPAMFPYYTRRYYQRYDPATNLPEDIDDHTLLLTDNMLRKLNFPAKKEAKLDLFVSYNTEAQYHGSFSHRGHCLLGVPFNFKWKSPQDFESKKDAVFIKGFPWDHPDSHHVRDALLLTDEEKEFLISRQLGYLDSKHVWGRLVQRVLCLGVSFFAAHVVNFKLGFYRGKKLVKNAHWKVGTVFVFFSLIGAGLSVWVNDLYNCYLDMHADKYAASINVQNAEAGRKYYDKIIKSNVALRNIIPGAEEKFTIYGNEQSGLFRNKTIPLIARRDYMKKMSEIKAS